MGLLDDFRGKEEINQLKKQLTEKDAEIAKLQTKLDEQRIANELEVARLSNSAEEVATANSAQSRELGQATVTIDRLTNDFEALVQSTVEDKSQAAIIIADLNKKLAAVAPEVAAFKAERDRTAQEIEHLRANYDDKDRGYHEREAKLAVESEKLLHDRRKFQQQAIELHTREQHWRNVVEPQLLRYEAHCSLDAREPQFNALRYQLEELDRNLKVREADLIRRQCTDETLATREAEIVDWDKLLSDTSARLDVRDAAIAQTHSEVDDRAKKLETWARDLAAFQERAKHLDQEASNILFEAEKLESKKAEQQERHTERLAELRQQRTELRRNARELTQREDAITERESGANETLRQAEQANAAATQKLQQAKALNGNLRVTEEKLRASTLANTALQRKVDKLNADVADLRHELKTMVTEPVAVNEMSVFLDEVVLRWMFKETEPRQLAVTSGYLCTTGTEPWPDDNFNRRLEEKNFSCWEMPDAEVEHIIVGRDDWDGDLLLEQIDSRQGESLRVYSQEMWFAMMATGRDPFDEEDAELLLAFGKGHPALEFLMKLELKFPWPSPYLGNGRRVVVPPPVSETPLHILGYRVGTTSSLTPADRQRILQICFSAKKLDFSSDSTQSYIDEWGKAESRKRLERMAHHIKSMVDGIVGRDRRRSRSRSDWIADLVWLKSNYYPRFARRFTWPEISVG